MKLNEYYNLIIWSTNLYLCLFSLFMHYKYNIIFGVNIIYLWIICISSIIVTVPYFVSFINECGVDRC